MAFEKFFDLKAPTALSYIGNLTPGDFAVVQNKSRILGLERRASEILAMLKSESEIKPGKTNPMGFIHN